MQAQCWICPKCFDDHPRNGKCEMSHAVTKCRQCLNVISQCRCMDHKQVSWIDQCSLCEKKKQMTYADQCMERAEKATEGPWDVERICWESGDVSYEINDDNQFVAFRESDFEHPLKAKFNAELYAHSRTDVPELARRLKRACDWIRAAGDMHRKGYRVAAGEGTSLADELERDLEEK